MLYRLILRMMGGRAVQQARAGMSPAQWRKTQSISGGDVFAMPLAGELSPGRP
jgi:hypothetical protein